MFDLLATRYAPLSNQNWPGNARPDRTCCLVCVHPADRLGRVTDLGTGPWVIGRSDECDLELADDSVSRRHALLQPSDKGHLVIDLGSTNGTYVNDCRVESQTLAPGDRLRIGNQIFRYISADRFEAEYLENAYRMITTDGLTQAYNKRYFMDVLERELRRAVRTARPLSVLMIDIDHFKTINDTYGHLTGDEVLIELTHRLRAVLRDDEVLARYGGEEFCVALPDADLQQALQAGERLRSAVAETPFRTEHVNVSVTISVGACAAAFQCERSAAELLAAADQQLYTAKHAGRNRVAG